MILTVAADTTLEYVSSDDTARSVDSQDAACETSKEYGFSSFLGLQSPDHAKR